MPMCHSIVDKIDLEEQRRKLNLVEFGEGMQGAFNVVSHSQMSMLIENCKKVGDTLFVV
jgi:hypothetical protein